MEEYVSCVQIERLPVLCCAKGVHETSRAQLMQNIGKLLTNIPCLCKPLLIPTVLNEHLWKFPGSSS